MSECPVNTYSSGVRISTIITESGFFSHMAWACSAVTYRFRTVCLPLGISVPVSQKICDAPKNAQMQMAHPIFKINGFTYCSTNILLVPFQVQQIDFWFNSSCKIECYTSTSIKLARLILSQTTLTGFGLYWYHDCFEASE